MISHDRFVVASNALFALLGAVWDFGITLQNETLTTEADDHAAGLFHAAQAHARGVHELSRIDVGLLLPAADAARSAYEAAVQAAWLLKPDDPLDREQRLAGYLSVEERFFRNMTKEFESRQAATAAANSLKAADILKAELRSVVDQLRQRRQDAAPALLPSVDKMLEEQGNRRQYFLWRHVSQLVHSAPTAIKYVRRPSADGLSMTYGFFAKPEDWSVVLGLAGEAVMTGAEAVAARLMPAHVMSASLRSSWHAFTASILALSGGRAPDR